jgi:hypothetical protein
MDPLASRVARTAMTSREEKSNRDKVNKELYNLCRVYHRSIPLTDLQDILKRNGFDPEAIEGIYTGRDGKAHDQVGPKTWLSLTWHKMEETGNWEINAYVS